MKKAVFVNIILSFFLLNTVEAQWQQVTNGITPGNAFVAGNEKNAGPLYIARVHHEGGIHIGKARANSRDAFIPYGGRELILGNYEVYTGSGQWTRVSAGNFPQNAVEGGREANGTALYIARATIEGSIHPGKARRNGDAFIPYGGVERVVSDYEVLTSVSQINVPIASSNKLQNVNSGKFLAVLDASVSRGTQVIQWDDINQPDIFWEFQQAGAGLYKIKNRNSGLYLVVADANTADGGRTIQWEDIGQRDILWKLIPIGNNTYKLQNHNSGKFLAVESSAQHNGAKTVQWADAGQKDIQWKLIPDTRVMTRFNPTVHGFKFVNNFTVQTQIAGFNGPTFSGLCGGMVYAALDYFHAGMTIPQQDYMPAEGMPLQSYLYNRQMNSVLPNADKWTEYGFNPGGARNREFFNWGLQLGGGRLGELRSKIDRGEPVPLGLQSCGGDCGCPGRCPGSHQVLTIGYDMGGYKGDLGNNIESLSIFVYDPNEPNKIMTLKPHVAGAMYLYAEQDGTRWRAYFTDMKYNRAKPPVIPNNPNELIATFKTGSDDLRGGNDNVHLVLLLRSGATMRFDNVNNLKRWADWSTQNISRPLNANFRAEDVVAVRLETTFGGGMGGDNWNLDELTVKTRLNGVETTILRRTGAPLVRFTGDRRSQEFKR